MKNLELSGRRVLWKWNNEICTIRHEAWGKYFIETADGSHTKVGKEEVILINE